jgi:hypothetical protein
MEKLIRQFQEQKTNLLNGLEKLDVKELDARRVMCDALIRKIRDAQGGSDLEKEVIEVQRKINEILVNKISEIRASFGKAEPPKQTIGMKVARLIGRIF